RQTVQFDQAVRALHHDGINTFIETSPHPVLTIGIEDSLPTSATGDEAGAALVLGTLRRGEGREPFVAALGQLFAVGVPVRWSPILPDRSGQPVALPTYPFQRQRYWLHASKPVKAGRPAQSAPGDRAPAAWGRIMAPAEGFNGIES
ncbi:hypothetical protein, partial [Streptomyces sp. NPDC004376]